MKTLAEELAEYGLNASQIKRIMVTLDRGGTVRTTYTPDIESIIVNDDSNVELTLIDDNGSLDTIERQWS